jgi:hypothetical protein
MIGNPLIVIAAAFFAFAATASADNTGGNGAAPVRGGDEGTQSRRTPRHDEGWQAANRKGRAAMTRKTYCGNQVCWPSAEIDKVNGK